MPLNVTKSEKEFVYIFADVPLKNWKYCERDYKDSKGRQPLLFLKDSVGWLTPVRRERLREPSTHLPSSLWSDPM